MLDTPITLQLYRVEQDPYGQDVQVLDRETHVLAAEQSLSNAFYYRSTAEGHSLVTSYLIHPFEYSGEQRVQAHGRILKVERIRPVVKHDMDLLEIMVGELDGR